MKVMCCALPMCSVFAPVQGLGEEYADDFLKATGAVMGLSGVEAKTERLRNDAKMQFQVRHNVEVLGIFYQDSM